MPCVLKFLTPEPLAAAIIGKAGSVIALMRETCQAKISLTDQGDFFTQTDCRVLTVSAETEESVGAVAKQIIAKLHELAEGGLQAEAVGTASELKLRLPMPRAAVGGLIGKGGSTIKALRETSTAKISVNEPIGPGPAADQVVSLAGSVQACEQVLVEVNRQVQALNSESWFDGWASTPGTTSSGVVMGKGGGRGGPQMFMPGAVSPGLQTMMSVAQSLPQHVMEDSRGFAVSCVVPERLVGGLIGRGGCGTKEVQAMTNTRIGIREIPGDPENRALNITGPLANTCAAYMLMMKRYLDAEHAAS